MAGEFSDFTGAMTDIFGSSTEGSSSTNTSGTFDREAFEQVFSLIGEAIEERGLEISEIFKDVTGFEDIFSNQVENVQALPEEVTEQLSAAITQLTGDLQELTDGEGFDFDSIRMQAVQDVIRGGIAEVIGINSATGTSTNSATAKAAEELGLDAAARGAEAELDARTKADASKANSMNSVLEGIKGLGDVLKGANTTATTETTQQSDSGSSITETGTTETESDGTKSGFQAGTKETEEEGTSTGTSHTESEQGSGGLLGSIGGALGF